MNVNKTILNTLNALGKSHKNRGPQNEVHAQRALLLMAQPRTSAPVHAAAIDTNTMTYLLARRRVPDLHGLVISPAGDVLAVWRVRHRGHTARVPRQRALLLMAQPRTSASVHAAANDWAITK